MKKVQLLCLLSIFWVVGKSKTVGYNYDLYGNRTQRVLGVSSTNRIANNDSTHSHHEPTMQLAMQYGISVFPNPTATNINVVTNKIPEGQTAKIIVYDNTGKVLDTIDNVKSQEEVVLQNYKPGIYIIAIIISDKDKLYYKIIKN